MRAWLQRRRRRQAAQLVASVMAPWVQHAARLAADSERFGFHHCAAESRREAVQLADVLRRLELELAGQELTLWVGDL